MKYLRFIYLFISLSLLSTGIMLAQNNTDKRAWLKTEDLSFAHFATPDLYYAPFTRWWWPGNDVTKPEIKREIDIFAENNFGGVEIQPFSLVMPADRGHGDLIMSYDTPSYYDNLKEVCNEALKKGITVDLTDGSGWPAGGPHLAETDCNLTLEYGLADIPDNNVSEVIVPRAMKCDRPTAKLVALLAVKVLQDTTLTDKTMKLDPSSIINITSDIKNGKFIFNPSSSGKWRAIAFWSIPDMETPMLIAKKQAGFVMNHFDSIAVLKNYNYLFGTRTGMQSYFGKPLRAIFDDSYEFKADRNYSDKFIAEFKKNRGYDVIPYLPANMWYGYNNQYVRMANPNITPSFEFSDEDWRLRYDYDLTLGDVLGDNFLKTTKHWTESRGLLHRTQVYGLNMDMIANAGLASIPEMETMQFDKGTEGGYKIVSSGAHLYNRPIVSCETAVFINRAFMSTPQKLKIIMDKLFSCGVNQIIYHGTAYRYFPKGYSKEGWYPFINSHMPLNFSSDINESNPFWKDIKSLNKYAQRSQYLLRSGKPQADVLIYYPFLDYSESAYNPKEIMLSGYMKGIEPPLAADNDTKSDIREIDTKWLNEAFSLIEELNAKGITWDWINDASVQNLSLTNDKQLNIRGNKYKSIVLFKLPYIQMKSAEQLAKLSSKGANILVCGTLPNMQPSFNNYKENDLYTANEMKKVGQSMSTTNVNNISDIGDWYKKLNMPIKNDKMYDFIRQTRRVMKDGDVAQYIWNESDEWHNISLTVNKKYKFAYWLNAVDGTTEKAPIVNGKVSYTLPPLNTIFLYVSSTPAKGLVFSKDKRYLPNNVISVCDISKWNIVSDSVTVSNTDLFDWKNNDKFKYSSKDGVYTSTFNIKSVDKNKSYFIDLGKVYFTAGLKINGCSLGNRIFAPYSFDISKYLKQGENTVEIKVTPTLLNGFVGAANAGDKNYKEFKDNGLMSEGLIGPVRVYKEK